MSEYLDHELYPGEDVGNDHKELTKLPERSYLLSSMGTCRMGPKSDRTAVVDNKLKVMEYLICELQMRQ